MDKRLVEGVLAVLVALLALAASSLVLLVPKDSLDTALVYKGF